MIYFKRIMTREGYAYEPVEVEVDVINEIMKALENMIAYEKENAQFSGNNIKYLQNLEMLYQVKKLVKEISNN